MRAISRGELRLENEIILIKGARQFGFDALTEELEKKVHETILEVNLGAMMANLNYYRKSAASGYEDGVYGESISLWSRFV